VPLLLLDLDNTLVDRASAFRSWAVDFVASHGSGDVDEVEWLVAADRDGYEPREPLAEAVRERFGLKNADVEPLAADLRRGMVDRLELDPAVPRALTSARKAGWDPVVVTNGTAEQQERKLRHTGLDEHVIGWVVSEAIGAKKPDAAIFEAAARCAGSSLQDAWMIGDAARADIAGAHRLGLRSVWLHRGRTWEEAGFEPTAVAASCPAAIAHVLAAD
jgi:putative hydrolase of the HAD superfamily